MSFICQNLVRHLSRYLPQTLTLFFLLPPTALGAETLIAVASNFNAPAKEIATAFEAKTGHKAILIFGSTGKLYAQIQQGAPFDAFLAADEKRPLMMASSGLAMEGSVFTYAKGKIALFSADPGLLKGGRKILNDPALFNKLAIANPKTAPYGAASIKVLKNIGLFNRLKDKLIYGENIAQTHQFITTGNAQLGFISLSQIKNNNRGSSWVVPEQLYEPIRQNAVLLKSGEPNNAARAFMIFLKSPPAQNIITSYGYSLD